MLPKIKNYDALLSHGEADSRRIVLDIAEHTLKRLDAYRRIKGIARMEGSNFCVGGKKWDLSQKKHVYLLGAGKACNHMARAVDEILGGYLSKGIAIVKIHENSDVYGNTEVFVGGHPLPNREGLRACQEILKTVDRSGPEDLFIGVVSGGSSALMSCPIDGITLEDEIAATDVLLKSGANIRQINAIRRHISKLNGGMLAKRIAGRGAELIGFGISDGTGTPATGDISVPYAGYKATPFGPDDTTLEDARQVISHFELAGRLPRAVVEYIMKAGPEAETPKSFPNNTYYLLNSLPDSCIYAKEAAESMGINAVILTSFLEGESRDAGTFFASVARQIQTYGTPVKPPCVLVASGEVTTTILDNGTVTGHGGPGQELTLGFALAADKIKGSCMFSIDTEGTDGTTDAAGGLTDSGSLAAARALGIDIPAALRGHAGYEALCAMGDAVFTGNTGTNLCDLNILYVPRLP